MEQLFITIKSFGVFTIILSILIIVHEWGHYITAKKLGVNVLKFSLGFGPKLFSWMHDGTEFLVCLIPLGGYVKMAGDDRAECKGDKDEFYSHPPGHRALIVVNGPVVNMLLAYVCLVFVYLTGFPEMSNKVGELIDGYPAQISGLKVGDKVVRINSKKIESWTELQSGISQSRGPDIEFMVLRDNRQYAYRITPRVEETKNIFGQTKKTRLIGLRPTEDIISLKYGFSTALVKSFQKLAEVTTLTYKALYFMLTGTMSAKESMTGPIGIFYIIQTAAEMGFNHLIYVLAMISASLALFNLLPIVPLDGGHLLFLAIEKLRGKTLPGKIDEYIMKVGISLFILLAIFVFYSDFSRFGWIEKIQGIFF